MIGVPLDSYTITLRKVSAHLTHKPAASFDLADRVGPHVRAHAEAHFEKPVSIEIAHNLPMSAFARLSADELCKVRNSTIFMMHQSVRDAFEQDRNLRLVEKIANSMWRWGVRRAPWNEIVDAYEGIRGFTLDLPEFDVVLDYTTGHNECGWSEHSRTYLDGVFGFLIRYKGEHVMTLGFSIASGRRLLLQQVQLQRRAGNRWLFRLPQNRIEFLVDRLRSSLPRHTIYLIDGASVAQRSLSSYRRGLERVQGHIERHRARNSAAVLAEDADLTRYVAEAADFEGRIRHLKDDLPRVTAFYQDTGRYERGRTFRVNSLTHYMLAIR